jgi:hypothetical protein
VISPYPQSDDEKDTFFLIMSMLSVMNQMDTLFSCLVLVLDEGDVVVVYLFSSRWAFVWFPRDLFGTDRCYI